MGGARRIGYNRIFTTYWPAGEGEERLRLAVKDNIDIQGYVTTAGSKHIAKTAAPAERDAKCLAEARARNVRIVGKTNMNEFALGSSGLNEHFGTPRNPLNHRVKLIPGGSSSGSAVAVAAGMADVSFGSDTGGSIRTPAACCGICGLKTTHGLVPLDGVYPLSPKYLDTVGPMAKDIRRLVQGMDLLQKGFAAKYARTVAAKPRGRDIWVGRLRIAGTDPAIDKAVDDALTASGFQVIDLDERFGRAWSEAQKWGRTIAMADAWLHNRDRLTKNGVASATRAILLLGEVEQRTRYDEALRARAEWERRLRNAMVNIDFIALPTLQKLPPRIPMFGRTAFLEGVVFDMQNTAAVNLAGNPALAMPIPVQAKDVPVTSIQLVGRKFSEAELLNAGRIIESNGP